MKKKSLVKQFVETCFAVFVGFLIVNAFCFFYERPVGWIDTPNGVSSGVRRPGAIFVHGSEGYGVTKVDRFGFSNEDKPLAEQYILIMGASHTQGREISQKKRYSTICDRSLKNSNSRLSVFNIAIEGNSFPVIIKHFNAAIEAFPNSSLIIIEVSNLNYSLKELEDALNQVDYDGKETSELFMNLSRKDRVKMLIKECFPLLNELKWKLLNNQSEVGSEESLQNEEGNSNELLRKAFSMIRSEYEGSILILYHPDTVLENDTIRLDYMDNWEGFRGACEENNIKIIDLGDSFIEEFTSTGKLPYGFANTTPGNGHLNETGHRIAANAILSYLKKERSAAK